MKRLFVAIFAVTLSVAAYISSPASAASPSSGDSISQLTGEYIQSYNTDTTIRTDGTVHVSESIEYIFDEPRHGIIRTIPFVKTNANGKRYKMTFSQITVTDQKGAPLQFALSEIDDDVSIKIGDPDETITGFHTYVISYDVAGGMTYFPGHDEWYWNAIGTQWEVPIEFARATVAYPKGIAKERVHAECFSGPLESQEKSCKTTVSDAVVVVESSGMLAPLEGLTVVAALPKGSVAFLEPKELVPFFDTAFGKIVLGLLFVGGIIWYVIAPIFVVRYWWVAGRDPKPTIGEARAWFSPPKTKNLRTLTPAETGTLVDETADLRDIYASIVDLARRGYIKIVEVKKNTFDLEKAKEWDVSVDLAPFERELLTSLFGLKDRVSLKDLDIRVAFEKIKNLLYSSLVSDGFFPSNPQTIRVLYIVIAIMSVVTFNPILFLVSVTFGRHIPRKTLFGSEQAAIARSLKKFLVSQDKHLAFQAKKQMLFEKLLPFAVAFGVEVIWAKRFSDLGLARPDWYVSSTGGHFNSVVFASSIGHGMSASFSASIRSHSSSGYSSGFSGGGSSGGGGGGGGGGSW